MILGSSSGAVPLPNKNNSSVSFSAAGSAAFWVDDVGTWVNEGGQTSKSNPSGYASYNATVASSPSQTAIISILDFDAYYFTMFVSADYLAAAAPSYDETACEYGFLTRADSSGANPNKITAVIDSDTAGSYIDDQLTTSSKVKMVITSTSFAITYSVDGTFTDTVNFYSTTFSSDTTQRMLVTNNTGGSSVDDNSITAEFE